MKAEVVGFGSTAPEEVCVCRRLLNDCAVLPEPESGRRVRTTSQLCEGREPSHPRFVGFGLHFFTHH